MRPRAWLTVALVGLGLALSGQRMFAQDLDAALRAFWSAGSDSEQAAAIQATVALHAPFEEVARAVRAGRDYDSTVATGRRLLERRNRDGTEFPYLVHVPESYDPVGRYPVRVYLHGGVMRPKRDDGGWWRNPERYVREDTIVVAPASWPGSIWWQQSQIENLAGILTELKRVYNIDENRVYLLGVSDGATGVYYQAFKAMTPWAGFLPFIGHPGVLANPSSDVDGEMYVANLRNKPFFVVNGGRDRLYPVTSVQPYIELFQRAGVDIDFRPQPEGGHDLQWWPSVSPAIDAFVERIVRDPLPDRLSWRTESVDSYNRLHWLLVDELGETEDDETFEEFNTLTRRIPETPLGLSRVGELEDEAGLRLMDVGEGSVFAQAGVEPDDVLLSVRGRFTGSVDDLREQLIGFSPGDEVPIVVARNGRRLDLRLRYPTTWIEQERPAFQRLRPAGRVDLVREGNTVSVSTQGVRRYTLLLSPDRFDFGRPIRVVTNGRVSHDAVVTPDVRTLLRWAARDQDRTLLVGAELTVVVGQ